MVEVGPRDGPWDEFSTVPAEAEVAPIETFADAGPTGIEAGGFVSPKGVPRRADTAEIAARPRPRPDVGSPVLVPDLQGLGRVFAGGVREVAALGAASESFSRRDIDRPVEGSLGRFAPVAREARAAGVGVRGHVSRVPGCPDEGGPADAVARVAAGAPAGDGHADGGTPPCFHAHRTGVR